MSFLPRAPRAAALYLTLALAPVAGCSCDETSLGTLFSKLEIEPVPLDFGQVPVGGQPVRAFVLKNTGTINLEIEAVTLTSETGEFVLAAAAPELLVPQAEMQLAVVYAPEDVGEDTAILTVLANDQAQPHEASLRGEGVQGGVAVAHDGEACDGTEGSMSFGATRPGVAVTRTIRVSAQGSAPVTVFSAVLGDSSSPEFTVEAIEETRLEPGAHLDVTATYEPVDGGPDAGRIIITTDAPDNPSISIPVCGQGVAPAVCARPNPMDLGALAVGQSRSGTLTLVSCGGEAVTISAIDIAQDAQHMSDAGYSVSNLPALPVTLAPDETTELDVEYTASALGLKQGWVEVQSDALNATTAYFPLVARGAMPCDLQVAPSQLVFANVTQGQTTDKQALIVNNGASECTVSRLEVGTGAAEFSVLAPTGPQTVAAGGSLLVSVQYAPNSAGPHMGVLEIEEGGVTRQVDLLGNPDLEDTCLVDISPPFVNFGAVAPNTSVSRAAIVTNISGDPCFLRGVELTRGSSPDFTNNSPNLGILIPGRTRELAVSYSPTTPGTATGAIEVTIADSLVNGMQQTYTVPLFASSATPGIRVEPTDLPFGDVLGRTTMDFTIYAIGTQPVTVTGFDWTAPDPEFSLDRPRTTPFTLQPGDTQQVTVAYTPADMTGDTAILTVRSDDAASPAIDVTTTGGREVVPLDAGRYLYYWQIPTPLQSDIMRVPLQGNTTPSPWWGSRSGKACSGCHAVSPDGRYVAIKEASAFRIVDTTTDIALAIPNSGISPNYVSWRPNHLSQPAYQYVYDNGTGLRVASLWTGDIGDLQGASDPNYIETMPTWGSDGNIVFVRGTQPTQSQQGGGFGLMGAADLMMVPQGGGTAVPIAGASTNLQTGANYYPAYAPNGQWIAYTYSASGQGTISAADARIRLVSSRNDGTVLDLPTLNGGANGGANSYPTWSVNGQYLSFSSNRAGGAGDWDIYLSTIDAATGADGPAMNLQEANSAGFDHAAQWSP